MSSLSEWCYGPLDSIREVSMLIYSCPTTAKLVHTSIEASETDLTRLRGLKISVWCPHCQLGHAVLGKDVQIVQDEASLRLRSAAQ